MQTKRNGAIDFMRGLAILLMILVHVTPYFLADILVYRIWNYTHFVVPLFVFCSAYIYFKKPHDESFGFGYIWKRAKRLLIPYYFFLIAYFTYFMLIKGDSFPMTVFVQKIFLTKSNSADFEWMVVLFLSIMLILPLIRMLTKRRILFLLFTVFATTISIMHLFTHLPIPFRLIMWAPWSLYILAVLALVRYESKRWFWPVALGTSLIITIVTCMYLKQPDLPVVLTDNKYPPNIFYIAYGIFCTFLIYKAYSLISVPSFIQKGINFLSRYSYSLFFIHFLIIFSLLDFTPYKKFTWWGMTLIVTVITVAIQISYNYSVSHFRSMLKKAKPL